MSELRIEAHCERFWEDICAVHDAARQMELERAGLEGAFLPLEIAAHQEGLFEYDHVDVALLDGRVVGFCAYSEEELAWLYVAPCWMRRGIGRALVNHALETEKGLCCVEVLWGNEPAKALYESCGFAVNGILSGKMPGNERFEVTVYEMHRDKK